MQPREFLKHPSAAALRGALPASPGAVEQPFERLSAAEARRPYAQGVETTSLLNAS
jgi:hypothetical protein